MAVKYAKKKYKQHNVLYTIFTVFVICSVFLCMIGYFYNNARIEAEENLHVQTKQIKDDIRLQLISDRENLATMASFAAKLYRDGETYDLMFESFKPIGLIANIGILGPDNTFSTKAGTIDLDGLISFEDEKARGTYISGRVEDLTNEGYEIIRSAVPIVVGGETVGVLYGVIKLDAIGARYNDMAKTLDAQLFVYDKEYGNLVIDTIHDTLGNISFLKDRRYNDDYSYEQMMENENGFTSFMSAYRDENLHMHYSTIDELGWMIALARYDSQVYAATHKLTKTLFIVFFAIISVMVAYVWVLMANERGINKVTENASDVRKTLLETAEHQSHIEEALKQVCTFAKSRSAIFFDTDGEKYNYISPGEEENALKGEDRIRFNAELLKYADELYRLNQAAVNVMCIKPNAHLRKTNPEFYSFLCERKIFEVTFAAVINSANHTTIVGTVNAKNSKGTRMLAEKVAICFSIALNNKKHLDKTELTATTDSLTGMFNRAMYNNDITVFDEEKPFDFSCVYIDVNELHLINNKYGHAAGDEMLLYIANTLKEVFYGHKAYRIGGDEFVVFVRDTSHETVKNLVSRFSAQLEPTNYHTAIGISYRTQNTNTDDMIKEAETRMYEAKAQYYQNKENGNVAAFEDKEYIQVQTGLAEIDMTLQILKEHYNGIYRVSLDTDKVGRILMPAYFGYGENEEHFSKLFSKYVSEAVDPDYHRAVTSFMNYESIKHQLLDGVTPKITYKKSNGETVVLSVYKISDPDGSVNDTLWVFAKE